jgi:hypothetical protein
MRYYIYRQNNSGGYFQKPAVSVIVPAVSAIEANTKVVEANVGVYFSGLDVGDCYCCGDRWYELSDNEYDSFATLGAAVAEAEKRSEWAKEDKIKTYLVLDLPNPL